LSGVLFAPAGAGPFPAVFYNHGSAAGMLSQHRSLTCFDFWNNIALVECRRLF
jgi:hypothetical protein